MDPTHPPTTPKPTSSALPEKRQEIELCRWKWLAKNKDVTRQRVHGDRFISTGLPPFPPSPHLPPSPSSSFQQSIMWTLSYSFFWAAFVQHAILSCVRVPPRLSVSPCLLGQSACVHPDTLTSSERVDAAADLEVPPATEPRSTLVIGGRQSAENSKRPGANLSRWWTLAT